MATYHERVSYFDKDFKSITEEEARAKEFSVQRIGRFQKVLGRDGKDQNVKFIAKKGEQTVEFSDKIAKMIQKEGINVENFFENSIKNNPDKTAIKIKTPKWEWLKYSLVILSIVLIIAIPIMYIEATDLKNFSNEVKTFDNNESVEKGDFAKTGVIIMDGYATTLTTTTTNYGIETGESTEESDYYILGAHTDAENYDTFILRYNPGSELGQKIEALSLEEILIEEVEGEIKDISSIPKLDQDEQVIDYFNNSIATYFTTEEGAFETPIYVIDSRVEQSEFSQVILVVSGTAALALLSIAATYLAHRKEKAAVKNLVQGSSAKKSGPVER